MLAVDDLRVAFRRYDGLVRQREIAVLDGLSFAIGRGEVLALVGASGAGKSLLAHALFGMLPPNAVVSGDMRLDGAPPGRRNRMGLVPQSPGHLDPLVRCGRQLIWAARRSGRRIDAAAAAAMLAGFGLAPEVMRMFPHQLSGGMARRVLLAIATVGDPLLVVADEPTSGLDPANAANVRDTLRRLADAGRAVLMITHDLVQALPVADRVALLRDGRLVDIAPAAAFAGDGAGLAAPYARAMWRAMPEHDFTAGAPADA